MAAYKQLQKGPLKLKGVTELGVTKRKKKKQKDKAKLLEAMGTSKKTEEEKRQVERILKKVSKTHKQRMEDFNQHLDTLTDTMISPK